MKHVCMIAYTVYSSDGRVRLEAETVASLPGYSVTVLTLKEKQRAITFEKNGVLVRELDIAKYQGKSGASYILSYLRFTLRAFLECTRLHARKSLDILHVHNMPNFLVFAGLLPYLAGKPIILDVHDTMVETYGAKFAGRSSKILQWVLHLEEAICCRMALRIVCVNDIQKAAMTGRGVHEEKIVVTMNVPDPKIFDHTRSIQVRRDNSGIFRMMYHGTVTKRVSVDLAIRAVSKLNGAVPDMEFHIVGDGDDLEDFRILSRKLGVEDKVKFRGRVSLENLVPILEEVDLGIIPNGRNIATELMLPVKMLECIALGIPVVAPRLKTIMHYFTEDMVFYFDPDDVDSFAAAIRNSYADEEARLRKAREARKFLETHRWETHKSCFVNMYKEL